MPDPGAGSPPAQRRPGFRRAPWERRPPGVPLPETSAARRRRLAARYVTLTGKVGVAAMAGVVFLTTAAGWVAAEWLDGRFREVAALDPESDVVTDAPAQLGDENFLLIGSDTRVGARSGDDVGTTDQVEGARADTIMIAHLPADRSRAVIVSFPRDVEIIRPPCPIWDPVTGAYSSQIDPGSFDVKINSAYEIGGPRCITRVVQQLSGLAVNHFLGIDFQGFKAMVDAVGGVAVCVERPLEDRELGTIIPQPGTTMISGDTALRFVRARMVVGDPTGDYGRITRQQHFLSSLLRELLSAETVFSAGRLRAVTDAVAANTFGENVGVATLLRLAQSLQGLDPGAVTFVTVPTVGEANENGNEVLRRDDTRALFRAIIDGTPLPGETPATFRSVRPGTSASPAPSTPADTGVTATTVGPADVLLRVLNGSGQAGQATAAARALRAVGFGVVETGNADELVGTTVIRYTANRAAQARALAAAVPGADLELDDPETGILELVIGPDFDGTVTRIPGPSGPTPLPDDLTTVNGADTACG